LEAGFFMDPEIWCMDGPQDELASGWEGTYCLRWAETETNGRQSSSFMNTCDGPHEQIELLREGPVLRMQGAEEGRPLTEAGPWKAHAEGLLENCGDSVTVRYTLHRQGQQVLVEKSWSHEGTAYVDRRTYER
jgi:hypothetical protein